MVVPNLVILAYQFMMLMPCNFHLYTLVSIYMYCWYWMACWLFHPKMLQSFHNTQSWIVDANEPCPILQWLDFKNLWSGWFFYVNWLVCCTMNSFHFIYLYTSCHSILVEHWSFFRVCLQYGKCYAIEIIWTLGSTISFYVACWACLH